MSLEARTNNKQTGKGDLIYDGNSSLFLSWLARLPIYLFIELGSFAADGYTPDLSHRYLRRIKINSVCRQRGNDIVETN